MAARQERTNPKRALRLAILFLTHRLDVLAVNLSNGVISRPMFMFMAKQLLEAEHTKAARIGRFQAERQGPAKQAGAPWAAQDVTIGERVAAEDLAFLEGFADDLQAGRYRTDDPKKTAATVKAIHRRAQLYGKKLVGTANEAWSETLSADMGTVEDGGEVRYLWTTHATESCSSCLDEAAEGPRTLDEMTIWPGSGETECMNNCRCTVQAVGYGAGFTNDF